MSFLVHLPGAMGGIYVEFFCRHFSQYIATMEKAVEGNVSEDGDSSSLLKTCESLVPVHLNSHVHIMKPP